MLFTGFGDCHLLYRLKGKALKLIRRNLLPKNEPAFMIIGAQKSGTSSLHFYLDHHPMLASGVRKEIGYFHRDIHFGKSYNSYKKDFGGSKARLYFESTPEYMFHPDVAENIYGTLPDVKLIVVLRDPVKRAYSAWNHYNQHFKTGRYINAIQNKPSRNGNLLFDKFFKGRSTFPSFRESIEIELELIDKQSGFEPALLRRGLYLQQLEEYWRFFDAGQILILGFKDLVQDTDSVLNKVCQFVGVQELDWSKIDREPRNAREYIEPIKQEDKEFLEDFYSEPNKLLFDKIGLINW